MARTKKQNSGVEFANVQVLGAGTCARWFDILSKHFKKDLVFFREILDVSTEEKARLLLSSVAYWELLKTPSFDLAVARAKTGKGLGDWYIYRKNKNVQGQKQPARDLLQ